jgi:ferredoxin/flavodoxin---NADP+ reductase
VTSKPQPCDVLIIGAGPVGLFGAFYAGLRGLSTILLDSLPEAGGQVAAMYPEKDILDVAGFARVRGRDLVDGLMAQTEPYHPQFVLGEQAIELVTSDDGVEITTDKGTRLTARAMLLTVGIGSFSPKPLPAAATWANGGVVHFVPQPAALSGHHVVIVGGGDSAVDWAHMLYPVAKSVRVVHRRDRFRAAPAMLERVRSMGIPFHVPAQVTRLIGDGKLTAVEITAGDGTVAELEADTVVAALGFHADIGPLSDWGVELAGRHIVVDSTGATNLPHVYAAGDIVTYPGKVALLATGFGEVATAANNIAHLLDPSVTAFPGHTSEMA